MLELDHKRDGFSMTLKEFAVLSGVKVERCDNTWGGTWSYRTSINPNVLFCGYRTESELFNAWARETFGKDALKALKKLMKSK